MDRPLRGILNTSALQIKAAVADVRAASEWLAAFGALHAVPPDQINRLDLCLNEALANVISYGDDTALAQPIYLHMRVTAGCAAAVTISDAGIPFDMAHAPIGERPHSLEEAEPGGLGLLMLRSFSDELTYQRNGDRNELTFCVRWQAVPTP